MKLKLLVEIVDSKGKLFVTYGDIIVPDWVPFEAEDIGKKPARLPRPVAVRIAQECGARSDDYQLFSWRVIP
jgi:hypothetical protein